LLARTGLLDSRRATTSWWLERTFRATFPRVQLHADELVTQDRRLWCGGAYTAYLNLGLRLVEELASPAVARACARIMLIDANRAFQTPYTVLQTHVGHSDDLVWRAQTWMQARLKNGFSTRAVAEALQVTERTLIRHFKQTLGEPPGRYLQRLRVEAARWLLEATDLSLEQIIERVGYADVSSFRRLFERETRLSPREYRHRLALSATSRRRLAPHQSEHRSTPGSHRRGA
jgi:transcriptional regulator GlxA family with amidase domain